MFEIELKAHVESEELERVKKALESFATFVKAVDKCDDYYSHDFEGKAVTVRLRQEKANGTLTNIFTYKKKEVKALTEVNDERECLLSDREPLVEALLDAGFSHSLHKRKTGSLYTFDTPSGRANIDYCKVEGLGHFIEIEILASNCAPATVKAAQEQLHAILARCGVAQSAIECRYYKELLLQKNSE